MGQYHLIVNVDKKEFLHPHRLGFGLKQGEFIGSIWDLPDLMAVAMFARPDKRAGGDFPDDPQAGTPQQWAGRWFGDRVVIVGDYAGLQESNKDEIAGYVIADLYDTAQTKFTEVSPIAGAWVNNMPDRWVPFRYGEHAPYPENLPDFREVGLYTPTAPTG